MERVSLGRGFFDEFRVTDFTGAAYRGDLAALASLLEKDPEKKKEGMAYYFALRTGREDVFRFLLDHHVEYPKSLYAYVMFERPEFLSLLPHDEEQIQMAKARLFSFRLNYGLIEGNLSANDIRDLIFSGADARNAVLVSDDEKEFFPVHLAALKPDLKVMKELVRAGVEPKMVAPNGKNAVRMVYENRGIGSRARKNFVKYFELLKKHPLPALTPSEKILLWFGLPLPPRTLPPGTSSSDSQSS